MKTNGLRNKKKAMARAAWRSKRVLLSWFFDLPEANSIDRWHRAAKGRK